jgi:Uma2 family endonuclease
MSTAILTDASWGFDVPPAPLRRFSVEEYQHMTDAGVLTEDDSVELLEGWIVQKMPKNPIHDATIDLLMQLFARLLPVGWFPRSQNVFLTGDSAPEPDVVIVRGHPRDYLVRHPRAHDVAVVVEVAETSLDRDKRKRRIYARAGVPVYWIVDVSARRVEVYSQPDPQDGRYEVCQTLQSPAELSLELDRQRVTLSLSDIFPPVT